MTRQEYQTKLVSAIWEIPAEIDAVAETLREARDEDRRVLIAGNGGSASTADHFACDLARNAGAPLHAASLNANGALLTAVANDEGYEQVFAHQVAELGFGDDVLVVISASGNSPSIISALLVASRRRLHTVALVGFTGGRAKLLADQVIHVESHIYGVVEDTHLVVCHLLTEMLR